MIKWLIGRFIVCIERPRTPDNIYAITWYDGSGYIATTYLDRDATTALRDALNTLLTTEERVIEWHAGRDV